MEKRTAEEQAIDFLTKKQERVIDHMDQWQLYRFAIEALNEKIQRSMYRDNQLKGNLRERLVSAIINYDTKRYTKTDAEKIAEILMDTIDELKILTRPIGSKVRIREDLTIGVLYGGIGFEEEMLPYLGKEATITAYVQEEDCNPSYLLDVDDSFWSWSEEMLLSVKA